MTKDQIRAAYERFKSFADASEDRFFDTTDDYELICDLFQSALDAQEK